MAREVMDIVKHQLGSLLMEVAILTSQLEHEREKKAVKPAKDGKKDGNA